ncbi:MAG: hypothetical protein K2X45_02105 [Phreatobacter sp.]|jgi:hypothetical protein|nr:hypothetical protein [Phreatobacter sp.]
MRIDSDLISSAQALDIAVEKAIEDPRLLTFPEECRQLSTAFSPVVSSMTAEDFRAILVYVLALRIMKAKALRMASKGGALGSSDDDLVIEDIPEEMLAEARRILRNHPPPTPPVKPTLWERFRRWLRRLRRTVWP